MNNIKPIISNQEGQNLFPGLPTFIKGNKKGTQITMKNTSPQIGLTPYGASYMIPNQDYDFAGDGVLEIPIALQLSVICIALPVNVAISIIRFL